MILLTGGAYMVAPRGACVVALGGHAWLLRGVGMRGCSGGACMVAPGGHAWLLGGHAWFLLGGVCGFSGGRAWFFPGGGRA